MIPEYRVLALFIALLIGLASCAPIPLPSERPFAQLDADLTTKADFTAALGRPQFSSSDNRIWVYRNFQRYAAVVSVEPSVGVLGVNRFLVLRFNSSNELVNQRVVSNAEDYCLPDGSCLVTFGNLDLRLAPKALEAEARALKPRRDHCSVYMYSENPKKLGRKTGFSGNQRLLLDGRVMLEFPSPLGEMGVYGANELRFFRFREYFYRLDLRPGAHEFEYAPGPSLARIPNPKGAGKEPGNLIFDCVAGEIVFIGSIQEPFSFGLGVEGFSLLPPTAAKEIQARRMLQLVGTIP